MTHNLSVWLKSTVKLPVDKEITYPDPNKNAVASFPLIDSIHAEAVVVKTGNTHVGLAEWEDSDMSLHYWIYEYEYKVPGKKTYKKCRDDLKFVASGWGAWFGKYPVGFRFPIRYYKYSPKRHVRMRNFD